MLFRFELAPEIEGLVSFLANLLIIEFRAELGFADTQQVMRTPDVFVDRRDDAELAAEIVGRIRTDEEIHVRSLNLYLGEMRSVDFRTVDGGTISGSEVIDKVRRARFCPTGNSMKPLSENEYWPDAQGDRLPL